MPGGIDYSKWDKMDYGDSSDEDDQEETSSIGEGDTQLVLVLLVDLASLDWMVHRESPEMPMG